MIGTPIKAFIKFEIKKWIKASDIEIDYDIIIRVFYITIFHFILHGYDAIQIKLL